MDWMTGRWRFDPRQKQEIFPLTSVSRPALRPTQPPVQWIPEALSPGLKRSRGVTLTTHPHLVSRSWMSRSYTSSLPCASVGVLWTAFYHHNGNNRLRGRLVGESTGTGLSTWCMPWDTRYPHWVFISLRFKTLRVSLVIDAYRMMLSTLIVS
jgi:hypothetical protein